MGKEQPGFIDNQQALIANTIQSVVDDAQERNNVREGDTAKVVKREWDEIIEYVAILGAFMALIGLVIMYA